MTDRELLEAAANAAGLEHVTPMMLNWVWNPLTDDGDALRLAVRLGMAVHCRIDRGYTAADITTVEPHCDDPCAATRRAIVRAAAAMVTP